MMDTLEDRREKLALAVAQLREAVAAFEDAPNNAFIRDSVIKRFEKSFELAWKCIRDWLAIQYPEVDAFGAKTTLVKGLEYGIIRNGDAWSEMLRQRNLTVHTYNEALAVEVSDEVRRHAVDCFDDLLARLA